jgi:hypothetical protein
LVIALAGCGVVSDIKGLLTPAPVYWTDQNGNARQVVFSQSRGTDLYDSYRACGNDWNCYQAYFEANRTTYKKRLALGRGQIRLNRKNAGERVYAEHHMDNWTDEVLSPFCYLALRFDQDGSITDAEYSR